MTAMNVTLDLFSALVIRWFENRNHHREEFYRVYRFYEGEKCHPKDCEINHHHQEGDSREKDEDCLTDIKR